MSEGFDSVADDVDAALVGGVELEDGFFVGGAQEGTGEAEDRGGFADARGAADDEVGHVAIAGDDLEACEGFGVADNVGEVDWAVFFDPGGGLVSCGRGGELGGGEGTRGVRRRGRWRGWRWLWRHGRRRIHRSWWFREELSLWWRCFCCAESCRVPVTRGLLQEDAILQGLVIPCPKKLISDHPLPIHPTSRHTPTTCPTKLPALATHPHPTRHYHSQPHL